MRDQVNMQGDGPRWVVLDGDIDPMWIESLNTLMDDNKVLLNCFGDIIKCVTWIALVIYFNGVTWIALVI